MDAFFYSLEWKKSEVRFEEKRPSCFSKEIKRPYGKIVYMIPAKNVYILTVESEDGQIHESDIYGVIKYYAPDGFRITKKFREKFEIFMSEQKYTIHPVLGIDGIYTAVDQYFSQKTGA